MNNFDSQEFYKEKDAIIEPSMIIKEIKDFPEMGVSCFSNKLLSDIVDHHKGEIIGSFQTENGKIPIYKISYKGNSIAIFMTRVGSPAAAIQLEEAIALGIKKIMYAGSCGALDRDIGYGDLIIPCCGERDEGTSLHYFSANEDIVCDPRIVHIIEDQLRQKSYSFRSGKTWTTDGLYRETKGKLELRKKQGCITVDMEYTALQAVANFRDIHFGQIFYCEDNLDSESWEARGYLPKNVEKSRVFLSLPFDCVINF